MTFCEKPRMKGDCLWITSFLFREMFKFKTVRRIFLVAIVTQLAIYFIEFYIFYTHPEYFLKYAPLVFARTYGFGAAIAILLKRHAIEDVWANYQLWALDSVGVEFLNESRRFIIACNSFVLTILVLFGFQMLLYLQPNSSDVEYYLVMFVIKQWHPEYSNFLNFIIKLLNVPIFYSMLVHCFLVAYGAQHVMIQIRMCVVNLKRIIDDYPGKYSDLISDKEFQKEIYGRLVFTHQRYAYFVRINRFANEKIVRPLFILYACTGFVLGLSVLLMMYEYHLGVYQNCIASKIINWTFLLQVLLVSGSLMYNGQEIQTMSEIMYEAVTQIKWYHFNERNRKCYSMLLFMVFKPIRLEFSLNFAVNYNLGVRFFLTLTIPVAKVPIAGMSRNLNMVFYIRFYINMEKQIFILTTAPLLTLFSRS